MNFELYKLVKFRCARWTRFRFWFRRFISGSFDKNNWQLEYASMLKRGWLLLNCFAVPSFFCCSASASADEDVLYTNYNMWIVRTLFFALNADHEVNWSFSWISSFRYSIPFWLITNQWLACKTRCIICRIDLALYIENKEELKILNTSADFSTQVDINSNYSTLHIVRTWNLYRTHSHCHFPKKRKAQKCNWSIRSSSKNNMNNRRLRLLIP